MSKNWEHAAGVLWPILTEAARNGEKLVYSDLAPIIDTNPLSVGLALGPILYHCLEHRLPPLTVLVIGKTTGVPGSGFIAWDADNLEQAYEQVFEFNWDLTENPFGGYGAEDTTDRFAKTLIENPDKSDEIYTRVKVRGTAQKIFRRALLDAYEYKCAMCGFSFEEALEAAHIVPWSKCEHHLRISPKNGILLCSNHHRLFDSYNIEVTPSYVIEYEDEDFSQEDYSEADMQASMSLHGKKIFLPQKTELQPSAVLLNRRAE